MDAQWILDHWELVVGGLFAILALILGGKRLAAWRWANDVIWYAWTQAEKEGLTAGLRGADKLRHYLQEWRRLYVARWGSEPSQGQVAAAAAKAAELSARDKEIRLSK